MIPVTTALQQANHEVFFATRLALRPLVELLGLGFAATGIESAHGSVTTNYPAIRGYHHTMLIENATDSCAWRGSRQVDVVVREPTDVAGMLAAERVKVPHATLGRSQFLSLRFSELAVAVSRS